MSQIPPVGSPRPLPGRSAAPPVSPRTIHRRAVAARAARRARRPPTRPRSVARASATSRASASTSAVAISAWPRTIRRTGAAPKPAPHARRAPTTSPTPWLAQRELREALVAHVRAADRAAQPLPLCDLLWRAEARTTRIDGTGGVRYLVCLRPAPYLRRHARVVLSPTQLRVATYAAGGARLGEIAEALGLAPETARSHLKEVYRRLGVASRLELARSTCSERAARRHDRLAGPWRLRMGVGRATWVLRSASSCDGARRGGRGARRCRWRPPWTQPRRAHRAPIRCAQLAAAAQGAARRRNPAAARCRAHWQAPVLFGELLAALL